VAATIQEVLTQIVENLNGYVSDTLAGIISTLDEPAPVPEATPVPAAAQPSELDTSNPAFGSETVPEASDVGPDPFNVPDPEPGVMGG